MRLLIDSCMSRKLAMELRAEGHDVDSVRDWPADPGDPAILARATAEERVLITADRGFGELALRLRLPTSGVIIASQDVPADEHLAACLRAIGEHAEDLLAGSIVIVGPEKMRARSPRADA